jgi:ankyrin repeat protein
MRILMRMWPVPLILLLACTIGRQWWQQLADRKLADSVARYDEQGIVYWLQAGASPNKLDHEKFEELWPFRAYDDRVVRMLLAQGADVNHREPRYGMTPLISAAIHGTPRAARLLVRAGAAVNEGDRDGFTSLMHGTREPSGQIVSDLLAFGADVNTRDPRGSTALMWAVTYTNIPAIRALLAHGADTRLRNVDHHSAYDLALIGHQTQICALLQVAHNQESGAVRLGVP